MDTSCEIDMSVLISRLFHWAFAFWAEKESETDGLLPSDGGIFLDGIILVCNLFASFIALTTLCAILYHQIVVSSITSI